MVRKYVKKSSRNSWKEIQLELAKENVIKLGQPINKTASEFGIPRTTLQKKIAKNESKCKGNNNLFFYKVVSKSFCELIIILFFSWF